MKKHILRLVSLVILAVFFCVATPVHAEGEADTAANSYTTSISITPLSKVLTLESGKVYEDSFTVTNNGGEDMRIETYASPYSYVYSEADDRYNLGFNNENSYTQISRWITFKNTSGTYEEKPTFTIAPNSSLEIFYKITTPSSIPAGGQYAVIFAHTLSASANASGIKTEACPGIIVYGRSNEGETIVDSNISNLAVDRAEVEIEEGKFKNLFRGDSKVKNTGNTDFVASGRLKVTGLFGDVKYETSANDGKTSIIPDVELTVSDAWKETPDFGFFRVTWTVEAGGKTESIERVFFLMSPIVIIITIIVLTLLIIGFIIFIKKRKAHRSRNAI